MSFDGIYKGFNRWTYATSIGTWRFNGTYTGLNAFHHWTTVIEPCEMGGFIGLMEIE